jgi:hypothetical protein
VAVLLLGVAVAASGKCPNGEMSVDGHLVPSAAGPVKVNVKLHTRKGDYEGSAIATSDFSVKVPFFTQSSSFLWFEGRCKNLPSAVVITAEADGRPPAEMSIKFKGNAIESGILEFRLRRRVVIEPSGIRLEDRPD